MLSREWNNLVRALENQSCILLVGPALSGSTVKNVYEPYTEQLAQRMAEELDKEKLPFDPDSRENLAYMAQIYNAIPNAIELESAYFAQSFYQKIETPGDALAALAKLPISLVINTTPDDLVVQAFRKAGKFGVTSASYNYRRPGEVNFERPTADKPLVYNLFGTSKTPESLVLTATNQLDFIGKVMRGDPPIPPKILQELDSTKTFLFIGFDWRQWHLQLLLRALQFGQESKMLSPAFPDYALSRSAKEIYSSLFGKIAFVEDHIEQFVGELSNQFKSAGAATAGGQGKRIFVSSHPAEENLKTGLLAQLKILEQIGKATFWHEGLLKLGSNKDEAVQKELAEAEIILILVSADYLADDNLRLTELLPAIAQQKTAGKKVIPIILEPSGWQNMAELTQCFPILPDPGNEPGKAITTWQNLDAAFLNVLEKVKGVLG